MSLQQYTQSTVTLKMALKIYVTENNHLRKTLFKNPNSV